jgi:trehalose utilization protein
MLSSNETKLQEKVYENLHNRMQSAFFRKSREVHNGVATSHEREHGMAVKTKRLHEDAS